MQIPTQNTGHLKLAVFSHAQKRAAEGRFSLGFWPKPSGCLWGATADTVDMLVLKLAPNAYGSNPWGFSQLSSILDWHFPLYKPSIWSQWMFEDVWGLLPVSFCLQMFLMKSERNFSTPNGEGNDASKASICSSSRASLCWWPIKGMDGEWHIAAIHMI